MLVAAVVSALLITILTKGSGLLVGVAIGMGIGLGGLKNIHDASTLKDDVQKLKTLHQQLTSGVLKENREYIDAKPQNNTEPKIEIVIGPALQNKVASLAIEATRLSGKLQKLSKETEQSHKLQ